MKLLRALGTELPIIEPRSFVEPQTFVEIFLVLPISLKLGRIRRGGSRPSRVS